MWLILEECGIFCAIFTYGIVVSVYFGFVRVGIWEEIHERPWFAILNFIVFQYHCFLIFMSHFKCMTSDPGSLPKDIEALDFTKLPSEMQQCII
jgi:hypothetical protein